MSATLQSVTTEGWWGGGTTLQSVATEGWWGGILPLTIPEFTGVAAQTESFSGNAQGTELAAIAVLTEAFHGNIHQVH